MAGVVTETHRSQVLAARNDGRPLIITTHTYLPAAQVYVDKLLAVFLESLGLRGLGEPLGFCLRELGANAKKANLKRLYFERRGLDPARPTDYEKGMAAFKRDSLAQQAAFLPELRDRNLVVKFEFLNREGLCTLAVRNNVEALPAEVDRVRTKLARARRFRGLEDAVGEVADETEGAGLGLTMLSMVLRNLGFPDESFQFYTVGGETVGRIILPVTPD